MATTFMSSAMVLSIGVFFTLMITGLAAGLPGALLHGLARQGVPQAAAEKVAHLPPVGSLFAAFLGYNPMQTLLGPVLAHMPPARAAYIAGRGFFPRLISGPFAAGLGKAFDFAAGACAVAAIASWLRGGKYFHVAEEGTLPGRQEEQEPAATSGARGI